VLPSMYCSVPGLTSPLGLYDLFLVILVLTLVKG
jgi:hypothetical protein